MRSQPPGTREGASASRTIPSLPRRRDASRLASLERAFARLLATRRNERARHRLPRVPGSTLARTCCSPRRRRRRLGRGDDDVSAIRPHRSIVAHMHSKTPTVRARSMTIKNKGPDRTNGKKSARDRPRRDETTCANSCARRTREGDGRAEGRPDGRVVRDGRGRSRCASFVSIGGARGEEEEGCRRRWARARTVDDEENARGAIDRVGVRDGDRGVGSGVDGERM